MGFFSKKREEPMDLESRAPQTGVKLKDMLVLKQLADLGANLRAPRHVLYYLNFDNRAAADRAAREASGAAFTVTVHEPEAENPDNWAVVCERHSYMLSMDIVRDNTDFFEGLAARLGGEYDGWEASGD